MLKISPAVTVTRLPGSFTGHAENYTNDYILFPDSEDPNIYYALAENPTFLADGKGNPSVNLTWYFGSGVTSGGICTMAVALPMPDGNNPIVKNLILEALRGDKSTSRIAKATLDLCKAMDAGDTAKVAQLKQDLGMNDATANSKKSAWDKSRDWEQFLPSSEKFVIRPIPFKTGKVTVKAFANKDAYQAEDAQFAGSFETTPSLFNSNAAVVTFNLSDLGANLFWHALGGWQLDPASPKPTGYDQARGGSSIISVIYQVAFDGMLPEAKAKVTLNHAVLAKLDIETMVHKGTWGTRYETVMRGKEYNDAIDSATEIVLPAVATKDDKDSVQKTLTDWAANQLEDMLKTQFPQVSLNDLSVDGARKIQAVQQQSRTYKLTQAVTLAKQPQALLPKIDGIVGAEALGKFFQLIDLNDVPYVNVGLTIRPPNLDFLKARRVERFVVTQLKYADQTLLDASGKKVDSIEYFSKAQQQDSQTYNGTFGRNNRDKSIHYSYLVTYTDDTPAFRSEALSQTDNNYLDLGSVDIGVLSVSLNSIDLPWDVLSSAEVLLKYDNWQKVVALTKDGTPLLVSQAFGQVMGKVMSYRLTLHPTSGAAVVSDDIAVPLVRGRAEITLRSPLGSRTGQIRFELDDAVNKAQLRTEYVLRGAGTDRVFSQLIVLDRAAKTNSYDWNVPVSDEKQGALRVVKARVDGKDLLDLSGGNVDPVTPGVLMTVYADRVDAF